LFNKLLNFIKKSSATSLAYNSLVGQSASYDNEFDRKKMQTEGYEQNIVVYRCVNMIAEELAKVPFVLFQNEKKIDSHRLLNLLSNPNPMQSKTEYFIDVISQKLITGNAYIEAAGTEEVNNTPLFLYSLNPEKIEIKHGVNSIPHGYEFKDNGRSIIFPVSITGDSNILHLKSFSASNIFYGFSPIQAAAYNIDQLNFSNKWNNNIFKNGCNLGGVFETGDLTPDQVKDLQSSLQKFRGAESKRDIILPSGVKYTQMGLTQNDMNFVEGIKMSAQFIAFAYGVPYDLVNTDQAKYENLEKAKELLWDNAVKPNLEHIITELNAWLVPRFGAGLRLGYDEDAVEAIVTKRARKRKSLDEISYMTTNEKRAAMGLEELEGGDVLLTEMNKIPLSQVGIGYDEVMPDTPKSYQKELIKKGFDEKQAVVLSRLVYDHSD